MIYPTILCGGAGTRLWPLSRRSYPKQFARFVGEASLFQSAAQRLFGDGFASPVIVSSSDFRFIIGEQLHEVGIEPGAILIEPEPKNTAPAILAAALHVAGVDPDGFLIVMPSDHVIPDVGDFRRAVTIGMEAARVPGRIVTFGIKPDRPETGFGWLELSEKPKPNSQGTVALKRFVEKPDLEKANTMLAAGNFLWNAGIFLMSVKTALAAYAEHAPDLLPAMEASLRNASVDFGFLRLEPNSWSKAESISVDYAIMEKAKDLVVVPYWGEWSDLGDWAAVLRETASGNLGLSTHGSVVAIDCRDSLLWSQQDSVELVGIGLEGIVAVSMGDAVLVADKNRAQEVKQAVAQLTARGARQAETFPRDHRPWGWFDTLILDHRFQVKRIVVNPGASLSLQSHFHRSEHWIVVSGTARVTIDGEQKLVTENQSVYVPLGSVHRMENPGKVPMVLIEVQTGTYLGEDDITRYEDKYSRGQGAKG
jgi:mannose-1-phosphate guanylyltransferase/mannose-6-phosphate isomerase